MPLVLETKVTTPTRADTVRFSNVPRIVRSDAEIYGTILGVFDALHYGTPCNQDYVHVTAPFSFLQGLNSSKRSNSHLRNKYNKKHSRTPLIVPNIIDQYKDVDPHRDQRAAPLSRVITMDMFVSEPEDLGGPTGTWPRV